MPKNWQRFFYCYISIANVKVSSDSELSDEGIVPEAIREAAKNVSLNLLPEKSRRLYTKTYNSFKQWRKEKGTNSC